VYGQAINSGERTFQDFLRLLDKSPKFKAWLKGAHPDRGLLSEHHRSISSTSWIESLPAKAIRFVIFNGAGLIADKFVGPAGSIALGAVDNFLVDKVFKGWRPSQFVEGSLRQFTNTP
jgi:hypothetical protein